jgi:hypothetical protein
MSLIPLRFLHAGHSAPKKRDPFAGLGELPALLFPSTQTLVRIVHARTRRGLRWCISRATQAHLEEKLSLYGQ